MRGSKGNLKPDGTGRRTARKDIHEYHTPEDVYKIIHRNEWTYKTRRAFYRLRDLALACLLYLTSGRINEVLHLKKSQFREDPNDDFFLVCHDFVVGKRWGGGMKKRMVLVGENEDGIRIFEQREVYVPPSDIPHPDIPLPRGGPLAPFTKIVEEYLQILEGDDTKLFTFGEGRAWCIIERITNDPKTEEKGKWNHWFRAQSLSYHVNLSRSTVVVATDRGVENPQTLAHYYTSAWKDHKEDFKR